MHVEHSHSIFAFMYYFFRYYASHFTQLKPTPPTHLVNVDFYSKFSLVFPVNSKFSLFSSHSGWFNETIPVSPVQKIAFLRLDGDLYISTKDGIEGLYPKLVIGG